MRNKAETRKCDYKPCGKEKTSPLESYIGFHPWAGWVTIDIRGSMLGQDKGGDFCSSECAIKYLQVNEG